MTSHLERAVIEAARALVRDAHDVVTGDVTVTNLQRAVAALDAADLPQEIGWHEVVEGDEVQSPKNKKFYPVIGTVALTGDPGGWRIKLQTGSTETVITRPTVAEPTAFVRRGRTGKAVDVIVNVMYSGDR